MTAPRVPVLAILGPTASGKTALSLAIARCLRDQRGHWPGAEIVGTDSMQCYRGMEIGTAAPTKAEQFEIPHHMLGVWPANHAVSVAEFQRHARAAIDEVTSRGLLPIVVGGSGLYASAVLDDLRFPGTDPAVRSRWQGELDRVGSVALHATLATRDPAAAAAILPSNGRRIVRALEVIDLTGQPFVATLPAPIDVYDTVRIGLRIPRESLDVRIAERVRCMWEQGLDAEVRTLQHTGMSHTAERALGYAQMLEQLRGTLTPEQAQAATVAATTKFARRQQRWFARDDRVHWIDYDDPNAVALCVEALTSFTAT